MCPCVCRIEPPFFFFFVLAAFGSVTPRSWDYRRAFFFAPKKVFSLSLSLSFFLREGQDASDKAIGLFRMCEQPHGEAVRRYAGAPSEAHAELGAERLRRPDARHRLGDASKLRRSSAGTGRGAGACCRSGPGRPGLRRAVPESRGAAACPAWRGRGGRTAGVWSFSACRAPGGDSKAWSRSIDVTSLPWRPLQEGGQRRLQARRPRRSRGANCRAAPSRSGCTWIATGRATRRRLEQVMPTA